MNALWRGLPASFRVGLCWKSRLDLELALVTYIGWFNARSRHRSLKHTHGGRTRRQAPLQVLEQYNQQASGSLVPK